MELRFADGRGLEGDGGDGGALAGLDGDGLGGGWLFAVLVGGEGVVAGRYVLKEVVAAGGEPIPPDPASDYRY